MNEVINSYEKTTRIAEAALAQDPTIVMPFIYTQSFDKYYEDLKDRRQQAQDQSDRVFAELSEFQNVFQPLFYELIANYNENQDYVLRSEQWSDQDKRSAAKRKRKLYTSNILLPFWRKMKSEELGQRTEGRCVAINNTPGDYTELCNHFLRWLDQSNDLPHVLSEIFENAITGHTGVAGINFDPFDPAGNIIINSYRPQEFMYDIYSARNCYLDGIMYVWRGYMRDRASAAAEFPLWEKEIQEGMGGQSMYSSAFATEQTIVKPKLKERTNSRIPLLKFDPYTQLLSRRLIYERDFYVKKYVTKYVVVDGYRNVEEMYGDFMTAFDRSKELAEMYMAQASEAGMQGFVPAIGVPYPVEVPMIDKYVFLGDTLVDIQPSRDQDFPFKFFCPGFVDSSIIGFMEHYKDDQRLYNVMRSLQQAAAAVGVKNQVGVNKSKLPANLTMEEIQAKLREEGSIWEVNDQSIKSLSEIFMRFDAPQTGSIYKAIADDVRVGATQSLGGLNYIGGAEGSDESGVAAQTRIASASAMLQPTFDQWNGFKRRIYEHAMYLFPKMNPYKQMLVVDEDKNPTYRAIIEMQDHTPETLKSLEFRVDIEQVKASPNERAARLSRLYAFFQNAPEMAQDAYEIILKYQDLDYSDMKIIMENHVARLEAESQAAQEERDMAMYKLKTDEMYKYISAIKGVKELEIQAANLPKITASMKLTETPMKTADILTKAGLPSHPLMVAADQKAFDDIQQMSKDIEQAHFAALTPDWEKEKGSRAPKGAMTPKNSNARSNKKVTKK